MKIRERMRRETTTLENLRLHDMFVIACSHPEEVYMVVRGDYGLDYLELKDGAWKDSDVSFSIHEQISIIKIEELEYSRKYLK